MAEKQLYQNDPRWKDQVLGHGTGETIGVYGCLLTSMAMVANHFGGDETVASFNEKMKQKGGFQVQWVRPAMISSVQPNVKYQKRVQCSNQTAPLDEIDAALEGGSLVVVMIDRAPAPGIQGHWVVLHEKQGDDYLMWDPWEKKGAPNTLTGRYSHGTPAEIIQDVIWFGGEPSAQAAEKPATPAAPAPAPTAGKKPTTDPSEPLVVHPLVDGLKMRRQPQIGPSNIIKQLPTSARLIALDPASARAKIGQHGEWMHVRDIEEDKGYVAAWYVTPAADPSLGVQKKETANKPTPPTKLVVKTTTEDVALRTQPQVGENTLIERLPFPTELLVTESGDAASKIGVYDQWLQVHTLDGTKGYVAAWYVVKA
ncbi:MAG: C39 family peptidase [Chloroflexota bacterium]|nr:C39 family peptidase [Chloroflexota bacterium]